MTAVDNAELIYAVIAAVFVASSLFARRLPLGQTLKMIIAWVAIFAGAFALFAMRDQFSGAWQSIRAELFPGGLVMADGTLHVRMAEDGHFWVNAKVNGKSVRLLVDSGATTTSFGLEDAQATQIDIDLMRSAVPVSTANGEALARHGRVADFAVGPIQRKDFPVLVSKSFGDMNVIGMNFLSTLKSWRVEGNELILNP
jgi:aspartyl protease family protein